MYRKTTYCITGFATPVCRCHLAKGRDALRMCDHSLYTSSCCRQFLLYKDEFSLPVTCPTQQFCSMTLPTKDTKVCPVICSRLLDFLHIALDQILLEHFLHGHLMHIHEHDCGFSKIFYLHVVVIVHVPA